MPLPDAAARNGGFDSRFDVGFVVQGPCSREDVFVARDRATIIRAPACDASHFAVINDPALQGSPPPLACTRDYGYPIGSRFNYATGGAWLECRDVTIGADEELRFMWNFVPFEDSPKFNDFALMVAMARNGEVIQAELLADVRGWLGQLQSGWQSGRWVPPNGTFSGCVRWVASNGFVAETDIDPPEQPLAAANRSPLLLDQIRVGPRSSEVHAATVDET